ncbi:carboxypeptidase-like regulatory domain-containing protein [Flavobacterium ardleyense]|uniref:Carboxypeptidase-like regulatory domain-containing protein n=1 Tax=Flavobacterium ardleyense TaxID=2038737 RepID=A0ABW5Z950_9FLAO
MILYRKLLLLSSILITYCSYSQLEGKCVDEFGQAIPYVNISLKGKAFGTVTNADGKFYFEKDFITEKDIIIISHLSFEQKTIPLPLKDTQIVLLAKVQRLEEVVVSSIKRKFKEKTVGTKTDTENIVNYFNSNNLGTEIGKIIKVRKNKTYTLKNVQFNIPSFEHKSATFRINFYNITDETISLIKINETDNIVKITKSGMVKVDISDQYLSFENDFLVAVEWIGFENNSTDENELNNIKFSSTVFSGPYISRSNVNETWGNRKLVMNIGIGLFLEVNEYSK